MQQQESTSVWYMYVDVDGCLYVERKSPSGGGFSWYAGAITYMAAPA